MTDGFSPAAFGTAFREFVEWAMTQAPARESPLAGRLRDHFGVDPERFPLTSERLPDHERPNLQVALDAWLASGERSHELIGFAAPGGGFASPTFSALMHGAVAQLGLREGPVQYVTVALDGERRLACIGSALILVKEGDRRLALLIGSDEHGPRPGTLHVEVMAPDAAGAERALAELRALRTELNVFRGKVISVGVEEHGMGLKVRFRELPEVSREEIVLPDGVLERVERHTVEFAGHADDLRAAGRHLKRGLLLHGPPGTGKTLTVSYLAGRLQGRTVLLLTGAGLGTIPQSCAIARELQPSMVVLEDVDLVASERTFMGMGATALLFDLLNEIDGMPDDADVIFVMTTNRPDLLEPALAQRPGRVDQAVHLPLPDEAGRRQLLDLFARGLAAGAVELDRLARDTEGASPAFIRELMRRAALVALGRGEDKVEQAAFDEALAELREGGNLLSTLLGARGSG